MKWIRKLKCITEVKWSEQVKWREYVKWITEVKLIIASYVNNCIEVNKWSEVNKVKWISEGISFCNLIAAKKISELYEYHFAKTKFTTMKKLIWIFEQLFNESEHHQIYMV